MLTDGFDLFTGLQCNTALTSVLAVPAVPTTWEPPDEPAEPDPVAAPVQRRSDAPNFYLDGNRDLARGWQSRARDNIAAISLSKQLEDTARTPTADEQAQLLRFIGFGATALAQNCFRRPGETEFRPGWEKTGADLESAVTPDEYAALQRATQYAHYTPEPVIRALWRAAQRLGFAGGRVLEPGMGTGLFFALLPEALRATTHLTGVEYDPVTARIARLVHPQANVRCEDYTRSPLGAGFDLAIGNPPFADRVIRADPTTRSLHLRLHDYFIARSIARLHPGALALFITSTGTMDKANTTAREHIASMADLVGAVRLPEGTMAATAGTSVVIDVLVFQRRPGDQAAAGADWIDLANVSCASANEDDPNPTTTQVNRYFADHPEMVLGDHALRRGIYGPGVSYTCLRRSSTDLTEALLNAALDRLPTGIATPPAPDSLTEDADIDPLAAAPTAKDGSYSIAAGGRLQQIVAGTLRNVPLRPGRSGSGTSKDAANIIRGLIPIRDAVREVLRAQATDQPWAAAQIRLRTAYSSFVRTYGPINRTETITRFGSDGELTTSYRRPNLTPFAADPDCWLVASIEDYDTDTGLGRMGAIFRERIIAPPRTPTITNAADALAVTLNELGRVDPDHLAELLDCDADSALAQLGETVFRNPETESWETDDGYLSGPVRTKLAIAEAAAAIDPQYMRNVAALQDVQPTDLRPSDISARLGAPWIPTGDIEAFAAEVMQTKTTIWHTASTAMWGVDTAPFSGTALGTSEWGTSRRNAGALLRGALNSGTPQIFDIVYEDGGEKRVLNEEATEAAKEKLSRIKTAFADWVWTAPDRADRLARIYNDRFNNLVPRKFDGRHLVLPGASPAIRLYDTQKRVIWRTVVAGSTYIAHAVGAGKSYAIAAAIMKQKQLGLIRKAMLVVPGHCIAQVAREFLQLYPTAQILVADETNFLKADRSLFLARAATNNWDAIIITHSAFRFIAPPAAFEQQMIEEEIAAYEAAAFDDDDRVTRKRIEAAKERLREKLTALADKHDDMLTLDDIDVDQIIVDEAHEFRKLSFATNQANLKGVDPDGSQRAWDLFVKARFVETKRPGRALILASGTPIVNTLGEMFTLLRFMAPDELRARSIHEYDAFSSIFCETVTELELQPSGIYKPVTRASAFVNVADLMLLFRSSADVVQRADLRRHLKLPRIRGGQRQLITAPPSIAFRDYQRYLAQRIEAIEARTGKVQKGDDILLSVITDGRHAAIDMRLVRPDAENEPGNKLNLLIDNVHRIWRETADCRYLRPDGTEYPNPGAGQMIFSDLGTPAVAARRGISAYVWIKRQLIACGVPAEQIAFAHDCKTAADKQRMFADFRAGILRVLLGSSDKMGTGANAQLRLKALHHLDVPWLPSHIEQREGRIERQGNQHDEIDIYAYATLGSTDATMWQKNEQKARFIEAALSGDLSIRRIEDNDSQANQFAMAKAIASGDTRLMQKAGLEADIARLRRQRAAHFDDQLAVRHQVEYARAETRQAAARISAITTDLTRLVPTRGDAFAMVVEGRTYNQRTAGGLALLSKIRVATRLGIRRSWTVGNIGGFDLSCDIGPAAPGRRATPTLTIERTDNPQPVDIDNDTTPAGLVSRLEHILHRMEDEREEQTLRAANAAARLASYEPRQQPAFPMQHELDAHLARLAEIEADLASGRAAEDDQPCLPHERLPRRRFKRLNRRKARTDRQSCRISAAAPQGTGLRPRASAPLPRHAGRGGPKSSSRNTEKTEPGIRGDYHASTSRSRSPHPDRQSQQRPAHARPAGDG